MKTAAIYARVSTAGQARDGSSLETQYDACLQHAKTKGYAVVKAIKEDASGAKLNRQGLDEIRSMAEAHQIQAVLCYDPDRLSRRMTHLMMLTDEFDRIGVELIFVNIPREDTPEGRMLFGMRGLFAEYEREKIKERVRRGREQRARSGKVMGSGMVPYGYVYVKKDRNIGEEGHLETVSEEAHFVRLMFSWVGEEGCTLYEVSRRLHNMKAPTKRGAANWHRATILSILHNECYLGVHYWNKHEMVVPQTPRKAHRKKDTTSKIAKDRSEWLSAAIPRIISHELWEATQHTLERNRAMSLRNCKREYLLRGFVICDVCGKRMQGKTRKESNNHRNPRERVTYECYSKNTGHYIGGGTRCSSKAIRADLLEEAVWTTILHHLANPTLAREMLTSIDEVDEANKVRDESALLAIYAVEQSLQKERDNLINLFAKHEMISLEELTCRLKPIDNQLEALEQEKARIQGNIEQRQESHANLRTLEELVELAQEGLPLLTTFQDKRLALEMLKAEIHIGPDGVFLDGILTDVVRGLSLSNSADVEDEATIEASPGILSIPLR